jgi:hypothetical protein
VGQGKGPEFKPQNCKNKTFCTGGMVQAIERLPKQKQDLEFKPQYHQKERKKGKEGRREVDREGDCSEG